MPVNAPFPFHQLLQGRHPATKAREFKKPGRTARAGASLSFWMKNIQLTEDWQPKVKEELRKAEVMLSLIGWTGKVKIRAQAGRLIRKWTGCSLRSGIPWRSTLTSYLFSSTGSRRARWSSCCRRISEAPGCSTGGLCSQKNAHAEGLDQLIKA